MKKLIYVLALALLLVPSFVLAQPPGCTWQGDPAFRYGWNYLDGLPYHQPGPDTATIYAGATITRTIGPYNAHPTWTPSGCKNPDTFCVVVADQLGWTIAMVPPAGTQTILNPGYLYYQDVSVTAPCAVTVCDWNRVIATMVYVNTAGACDITCGDCNDPNTRPADGKFYYSADTLWIHVIEAPPALAILQDTLTLVERGQTQAFVPFAVCNQDECAPPTLYGYNIISKGHVGGALNVTASVTVNGGACVDVYGVLDASAAIACTYDTLRIIVWTTSGDPIVYDTCVQVVHIIEPEPVPLFTVPVITILVLALILAAAVFMRRRAVSRA